MAESSKVKATPTGLENAVDAPLDFAKIMAVDDLPVVTVPCPEWGGALTVRALSMQDRVAINDYADKHQDIAYNAIFLGRAIYDPKTDKRWSLDQAAVLNSKNGSVISRLVAIVQGLGLDTGPEGEEEAKKD